MWLEKKELELEELHSSINLVFPVANFSWLKSKLCLMMLFHLILHPLSDYNLWTLKLHEYQRFGEQDLHLQSVVQVKVLCSTKLDFKKNNKDCIGPKL